MKKYDEKQVKQPRQRELNNMKVNHNLTSKQRRTIRIRSKVRGTAERPRVTVHRSNLTTRLQVINDEVGKTLVSATREDVAKATGTKTELAIAITKALVEKMKKAHITRVVFDRGPYKYHGRVKAVADTLREGGIQV